MFRLRSLAPCLVLVAAAGLTACSTGASRPPQYVYTQPGAPGPAASGGTYVAPPSASPVAPGGWTGGGAGCGADGKSCR